MGLKDWFSSLFGGKKEENAEQPIMPASNPAPQPEQDQAVSREQVQEATTPSSPEQGTGGEGGGSEEIK